MRNEHKSSFGLFLKTLRTNQNLSQHELSKKMKISFAMISNLENSTAYPTDRMLQKYSHFFDIPLEELQKRAEKDRDVFRIKNLNSKIQEYQAQVLKIYTESKYRKDLFEIIQNVDSNDILCEELKYLREEKKLSIPYFPTINSFKRYNNKTQKHIEYRSYMLNPKNYSNSENIICINTSKSLKSMNRIFPEYSDVFIEFNTKLNFDDIIFCSIDNEYRLGRLKNIQCYDKYTTPIICFESLELNYLHYIPLNEETIEHIEIYGKVIAVHISDKLLNL